MASFVQDALRFRLIKHICTEAKTKHLLHAMLWGGAVLGKFICVVELIFAAGVGEVWDCVR